MTTHRSPSAGFTCIVRACVWATACGLLATPISASLAKPAGSVVLAISSGTSPAHEATLAAFETTWTLGGVDRKVVSLVLKETDDPQDVVASRIREVDPCALLTLGTAATRAAIASAPDRPLVATLIVDPGILPASTQTRGILVEQPLLKQFEAMRSVLPAARHLGVLYSSEANARRVAEAALLATRFGFELHAVLVKQPEELPGALHGLLKEIDVLWGLPDPVTLNQKTAKAVLLTTFQERIPFIGPSAAWAKAGALYALDCDYSDLGAQSAELLAALQTGVLGPGFDYPRKSLCSVNLQTAEKIDLQVPKAVIENAAELFR